MSSSLRLTIPEPCHEKWKDMAPNEQGRHCMSCQKTVVDFSLMTDKEILDHISNAHSNVCGRFDHHQLNRGLHDNKIRKRFSLLYVWNLVVMLFLFAGKAKAQGKIKAQKLPSEKSKVGKRAAVKICPSTIIMGDVLPVIVPDTTTPDKLIPGTIVRDDNNTKIETLPKGRIHGMILDDETGDLIPFASVTVGENITGTRADSSGNFNVDAEAVKKAGYITVSAIGYEITRVDAPTNSMQDIYVIGLKRKPAEMDEVVVHGYGSIRHRAGWVGGVTAVQEITLTEKVTRQWGDWFPKTDVVVYPNPLPRGQSIQVALQLKEKGQYRLEIIDGGGRVMWIENVNVPSSKHTLSLVTQHHWPAGVYWLRLTGTLNRTVYNRKIVLR